MRKLFLFLAITFLILFSLNGINANTVCGLVHDSDNFSASWMNVLVYYSENPQNTITCKINPENKFCCALEEIKGINWIKGKLVYAEVFEKDLGYTGGPVSLITSEEGYDIFPEIQIKKAITFNSPVKKILINESKIFLNLSLDNNYSNLNYSLNSSDNSSHGIICQNCQNKEVYLDLFKGKNTLKLTAYGKREISEEIEVYYLDYFTIKDSFQCPRCITNGNNILVPSNTSLNLKISFNSSHEVTGDILTYFPLDWIINDSSLVEDYSATHQLITNSISGKYGEVIYSFTTPKVIFNRKDFFKYEFADLAINREVTVYRFFRFLPFHSSKRFSNLIYIQKSLNQIISPSEPLVLVSEDSPLELVAIYPKTSLKGVFAYLNFEKQKTFKKNEYKFDLSTNLQASKVKTILFRFKCPKDKTLEFYDSSTLITLQKYDEDSNYFYFEGYYPKKGNFRIILK